MVRKMPKRGFTLIEVVIALVIFVIGALAVIRIFPPTFSVVQNSSYQNIATRLADSIVSQMKGEQSTPLAVFDVNESGTLPWAASSIEVNWQDQDGAVEGTASKNASLPTGPTDDAFEKSALSHYRFIRGETHTIQNAAGNDGDTDAPYILTNFPYTADANGGVRLYITLKIDGVAIKNGLDRDGNNIEGKLDFSRATYTNPFTGKQNEPFHESGANADRPKASDSSSGVGDDSSNVTIFYRSPIDMTADTGARFYVSYRYVDGVSGRMTGVIDEPLSVPEDANWEAAGNADNVARVLQGMLNFKLPAGDGPSIVAGSVQVKVRGAVVFLDDVGDPIPLGINQDAGGMGFVPMPPVYAGDPEVEDTTSKMPIVPVSADYLVPDWRILFNQSKPTNDGKVFLPINLMPQGFAPRGVAVDATSGYTPVIPAVSNVDSQQRMVQYDSAYPTVRTAYKALDQWAQQISPAAESYVPFDNNTSIAAFRDPTVDTEHYYLPREPWREYYWAFDTNTMYFHPSEAGKTVRVRFIPTGATQAIEQVLVISKDVIEVPAGVPVEFAPSGHVAALALKDMSGTLVTAEGVLGVTGMSVLARTAWLNGETYNQVVVSGYRGANGNRS